MNSREKKSKSFNALLRCMIKVFMDSSNVKIAIDSTLRVSSITNFIIGRVHEYIFPAQVWYLFYHMPLASEFIQYIISI